MSLLIVFHELAERELNDAASYYAAQDRPGLADAFLGEVQRVLQLISSKPLAGSSLDDAIRKWRLRKFPHAVIYRTTNEHVRVLAIAAHKRRPSYWAPRR